VAEGKGACLKPKVREVAISVQAKLKSTATVTIRTEISIRWEVIITVVIIIIIIANTTAAATQTPAAAVPVKTSHHHYR
jgi:hypothetical protein